MADPLHWPFEGIASFDQVEELDNVVNRLATSKQVAALTQLVIALNQKVNRLMALVSIEQSELDEIAQDVSDTARTVSEVADALQGIIDNEHALDPADESALNAAKESLAGAVTKLQGVGPKVPTEPPVDENPPVDE